MILYRETVTPIASIGFQKEYFFDEKKETLNGVKIKMATLS